MGLQMELTQDYAEMSARCAHAMVALVRAKPDACIVLATGHSPLEAYRLFVREVLARQIDVSGITWIKLDEWVGVPKENPSTCEYFLRQEILEPLRIDEARFLSFDPLCADPLQECARVEAAIAALEGIDLAILGVGMNGHLGLNEPAESLDCRVHSTALSSHTLGHAMLKKADSPIQQGMTLGLSALFQAKQVLLLASGGRKVLAMQALASSEISPTMPVTFLKLHPHALCWIDGTMPL